MNHHQVKGFFDINSTKSLLPLVLCIAKKKSDQHAIVVPPTYLNYN